MTYRQFKQIDLHKLCNKKDLGTSEVFPKETFTSLMVVLQSSKVLIYAWTAHVKICDYLCEFDINLHLFLREFDITYWIKTLP